MTERHKANMMCASCAAVGINLSFIQKIVKADGHEYNALGVQKDSNPVDLKGSEVKHTRTNMQVCKAYLVRSRHTHHLYAAVVYLM